MYMQNNYRHSNSSNNIRVPINYQELLINPNKNSNSVYKPQNFNTNNLIKNDGKINELINTCNLNLQNIKDKISELGDTKKKYLKDLQNISHYSKSNISTSASNILVQRRRTSSHSDKTNYTASPNYNRYIPFHNYSTSNKKDNYNNLFDNKGYYFNYHLNNIFVPQNDHLKNKNSIYLSNYTSYNNYIDKKHNSFLSHKNYHQNSAKVNNTKTYNDLNNLNNINSIRKSSYIITNDNFLNRKNSQVAKLMQQNKKFKSQVNTINKEAKENNKEKAKNYFKQLQNNAKEIRILRKSILDYQKANKSLKQQVFILNNELAEIRKNSSAKTIKPKNNDIRTDSSDQIEKLVKMNDLYKKEIQEKNINVNNIKKRNDELISENDEYKNQIQKYKNYIDKLNAIINEKDKFIKQTKKNLKEGQNARKKTISFDKLLKENDKNKKDIENLKNEIKTIKDMEIKYNSLIQSKVKNGPNSPKDFTNNNQKLVNNSEKNLKEIESNKSNFNSQDTVKLSTNNNKVDIAHSIKSNRTENIINSNINTNLNTIDDDKIQNKNIINNKAPFKNESITFEKIKEVSNEINNNDTEENEDNCNYNYNSTTLKIYEKNNINIKKNKSVLSKNRLFENCFVKISDKIILSLLDFIYEINPDIYKFRIKYKYANSKIFNDIFLYGIDEKNIFYKFDICNKLFTKQKISELIDLSNSFINDFQYEGTIIYNTLYGVFLLTGIKTNILYFYHSYSESIIKICEFRYSHNNGTLLLDEEQKRIFALSGKNSTKCEFLSFIDMNVYEIADLNIDRANATFIFTDKKIFCFFGFCYSKNIVLNNIEIIDSKKLNKWENILKVELIGCNSNDLMIESMGGIYNKKFTQNKIILYSGLVGDNQEIMKGFYYEYDINKNEIKKIKKWINNQYTYKNYYGSKIGWKKSEFTEEDFSGFIFAKCTNFLHIPKEYKIEGYLNNDKISVLIDYKNNVHFIVHEPFQIDIYRSLK